MAHPALKPDATDVEMKSPETLEYEQIATLAYALWEARGCPEGSPQVDWFHAEQELTTSR
jgi:hypothetical protein